MPRVLKCVFIDTVNINVMQMESESNEFDHLLCEDIEDYVKCEQHCLCIINKVADTKKLY